MTELCSLSDLETPDELLVLDEKLDERVSLCTGFHIRWVFESNLEKTSCFSTDKENMYCDPSFSLSEIVLINVGSQYKFLYKNVVNYLQLSLLLLVWNVVCTCQYHI